MLSIHYPTTDSTSTRAMRLAALNPGRPVLVSAAVQTAGRGRTGREWRSPAGGAWFSIAWPVCGDLRQAQAAPLLVGLAVREALLGVLGHHFSPRLKIKWPNDLLLDDRKIAGILCEQSFTPDGLATIFVGVGINANNTVASLGPAEQLRQPPVSLVDVIGRPIDVRELVADCAARIATWMGRLETHGLTTDMLRRLRLHLAWVGEPVTLDRQRGRAVAGRLLGVDRQGRLTVATPHGPMACDAGEVQRLRHGRTDTHTHPNDDDHPDPKPFPADRRGPAGRAATVC